ncbi:MAG: cupredoxin domain-containing protein [Candidimonas sp.]|nr:MAG: cupredoxin domain-containing protein [Candidimonas sp.]
MKTLFALPLTLALAGLAGSPVFAAEASYELTIQNDGFSPATLAIPAGERVKIVIKNARTLPSEFESAQLGREKVVPGGTTLALWVGPLKPGKYKFFDDFNPKAVGWIVATPHKE